MEKYKDKETGKYEELKYIKEVYKELLGNTYEFEEYRDDFDKYLQDFYEIEDDEEEFGEEE